MPALIRELRGRGLCAILLGMLSSSCAAESSQAPAPSPDCVVASWGDGESLTVADVDGLRASVSPSPKGVSAKRWAIDVHLASWDRGSADRTPSALVNEYRAWLASSGSNTIGHHDPDQLRRASEEIRQRAGLTPGPCFNGQ